MIGAALAERNDVVDFHPRMGLATRCADLGGPDFSYVGSGQSARSHVSGASRMRSGSVNSPVFFRVFFSPSTAQLKQLFSVLFAVLAHLFLVPFRVLSSPLSAGIDRLFLTLRFLASVSLLLAEKLGVLLALLTALCIYFIAFLGQVLRVVGAQIVLILRAPSRLIGGVAVAVLFRPQFRAQPRFDLPLFRAIHKETLPHGLAANNYAA